MFAFLLALLVFSIILAASSVYTVPQDGVMIVERFGKFLKIEKPGLRFKIPFVDVPTHPISLRIMLHACVLETKTHDNVFVQVHCSIQYKVLEDKIFEARYSLWDVEEQLEAYVFDTIRAIVPQLTLDKLFEQKVKIAAEVKEALDSLMNNFGYAIQNILITHLDPDEKVKTAMNEINAAERERVAASYRAEAEKIMVIKGAEAQKESRILQGEGIAGQRKAIIHGLRESLNELRIEGNTITEREAIDLLLTNQYFDTLKEIGASSKSNTIFLNHNNFEKPSNEELQKTFQALRSTQQNG